MQTAENLLRRVLRAAILPLVAVAIVGTAFLLDQIGVGDAAGEWTIVHVTEGREGPRLPVKVGDQLHVLRTGHVRLPDWDGRFGVLGRALCGWNCFVLDGLRQPGQFRMVLAPDSNFFRLTGAGGFVLVGERKRKP